MLQLWAETHTQRESPIYLSMLCMYIHTCTYVHTCTALCCSHYVIGKRVRFFRPWNWHSLHALPLACPFYLQRQRRSMPDNSCCYCCCCGEKVQNRGLEARYRHRPLHNYCRECKIKVILFNDLWPQRSFEVTLRSFTINQPLYYQVVGPLIIIVVLM